MATTGTTREAIAFASTRTSGLIDVTRNVLASLKADNLETTPLGEHLQRALTELERAQMQARAFLGIG